VAQAIREGNVATVHGRGDELLMAQEEVGRVRREESPTYLVAASARGRR
jgi:hypothetical protein